MRVTLIVAAARNNVIGRDGAMPWRLSADLKRFKTLTLGKPVIMGRKTFESIGKPLPSRTNIVVSQRAIAVPGVTAVRSFDAALDLAARAGDEAMVIGGARIYEAALPVADRIHFTRIDAEVAGDARFPQLEPSQWRKTAAGFTGVSPQDDYPCRYFILDRHP